MRNLIFIKRFSTQHCSITPVLTSSLDESLHRYPWNYFVPAQKKHLNVMDKLHDEIIGYSKWAKPTENESKIRKAITTKLDSFASRTFSQYEFAVFGSTATGLCLPTADIDLAICIPPQPAQQSISVLYRIGRRIQKMGMAEDIKVVPAKKVPILTFKTTPQYGSLRVDLGLANQGGSEGTQYIRERLARMPGLRPLILVLKTLLSQNNLNDASLHGLCSYAISMLCISFLQINPMKRPEEWLTEPWKTRSLGYLLSDLLSYFGSEFDPKSLYIDPKHSVIFQKISEMDIGWIKPLSHSSLCIRDPLNREKNVGRALNAKTTRNILHLFNQSHEQLMKLTLQDQNALGTLIHVPQSILDHRNLLKELNINCKDKNMTPPTIKSRPHPAAPIRQSKPGDFKPKNTHRVGSDTSRVPPSVDATGKDSTLSSDEISNTVPPIVPTHKGSTKPQTTHTPNPQFKPTPFKSHTHPSPHSSTFVPPKFPRFNPKNSFLESRKRITEFQR